MTDDSELAVSEARQSGVVVPDSIEHVKGVEGIDILFLCIWGGWLWQSGIRFQFRSHGSQTLLMAPKLVDVTGHI